MFLFQIDCSAPEDMTLQAPEGCLQYHTSQSLYMYTVYISGGKKYLRFWSKSHIFLYCKTKGVLLKCFVYKVRGIEEKSFSF